MLKRVPGAIVIAALVTTAGCLEKETAHTLYLSSDGAVSWAASESNVHSDEKQVGARIQEEQEYAGAALLGTHGVARGLAAVGAQGPIRTTVVRDEVPFHVITEARFDRIDRLLERLFTKAGIRTAASFVHDGDGATLRVRLEPATGMTEDGAVSDLVDVEHFRFVLIDATFAESIGFDTTDTTAVFSREWLENAEQAFEDERPIEFTLSWRTR
jgi:hypothetical protein